MAFYQAAYERVLREHNLASQAGTSRGKPAATSGKWVYLTPYLSWLLEEQLSALGRLQLYQSQATSGANVHGAPAAARRALSLLFGGDEYAEPAKDFVYPMIAMAKSEAGEAGLGRAGAADASPSGQAEYNPVDVLVQVAAKSGAMRDTVSGYAGGMADQHSAGTMSLGVLPQAAARTGPARRPHQDLATSPMRAAEELMKARERARESGSLVQSPRVWHDTSAAPAFADALAAARSMPDLHGLQAQIAQSQHLGLSLTSGRDGGQPAAGTAAQVAESFTGSLAARPRPAIGSPGARARGVATAVPTPSLTVHAGHGASAEGAALQAQLTVHTLQELRAWFYDLSWEERLRLAIADTVAAEPTTFTIWTGHSRVYPNAGTVRSLLLDAQARVPATIEGEAGPSATRSPRWIEGKRSDAVRGEQAHVLNVGGVAVRLRGVSSTGSLKPGSSGPRPAQAPGSSLGQLLFPAQAKTSQRDGLLRHLFEHAYAVHTRAAARGSGGSSASATAQDPLAWGMPGDASAQARDPYSTVPGCTLDPISGDAHLAEAEAAAVHEAAITVLLDSRDLLMAVHDHQWQFALGNARQRSLAASASPRATHSSGLAAEDGGRTPAELRHSSTPEALAAAAVARTLSMREMSKKRSAALLGSQATVDHDQAAGQPAGGYPAASAEQRPAGSHSHTPNTNPGAAAGGPRAAGAAADWQDSMWQDVQGAKQMFTSATGVPRAWHRPDDVRSASGMVSQLIDVTSLPPHVWRIVHERVTAVLSRMPIALRRAYERREAVLQRGYTIRMQWMKWTFCKQLEELRAQYRGSQRGAVSRVAHMSSALRSLRSHVSRLQAALEDAGVRLAQRPDLALDVDASMAGDSTWLADSDCSLSSQGTVAGWDGLDMDARVRKSKSGSRNGRGSSKARARGRGRRGARDEPQSLARMGLRPGKQDDGSYWFRAKGDVLQYAAGLIADADLEAAMAGTLDTSSSTSSARRKGNGDPRANAFLTALMKRFKELKAKLATSQAESHGAESRSSEHSAKLSAELAATRKSLVKLRWSAACTHADDEAKQRKLRDSLAALQASADAQLKQMQRENAVLKRRVDELQRVVTAIPGRARDQKRPVPMSPSPRAAGDMEWWENVKVKLQAKRQAEREAAAAARSGSGMSKAASEASVDVSVTGLLDRMLPDPEDDGYPSFSARACLKVAARLLNEDRVIRAGGEEEWVAHVLQAVGGFAADSGEAGAALIQRSPEACAAMGTMPATSAEAVTAMARALGLGISKPGLSAGADGSRQGSPAKSSSPPRRGHQRSRSVDARSGSKQANGVSPARRARTKSETEPLLQQQKPSQQRAGKRGADGKDTASTTSAGVSPARASKPRVENLASSRAEALHALSQVLGMVTGESASRLASLPLPLLQALLAVDGGVQSQLLSASAAEHAAAAAQIAQLQAAIDDARAKDVANLMIVAEQARAVAEQAAQAATSLEDSAQQQQRSRTASCSGDESFTPSQGDIAESQAPSKAPSIPASQSSSAGTGGSDTLAAELIQGLHAAMASVNSADVATGAETVQQWKGALSAADIRAKAATAAGRPGQGMSSSDRQAAAEPVGPTPLQLLRQLRTVDMQGWQDENEPDEDTLNALAGALQNVAARVLPQTVRRLGQDSAKASSSASPDASPSVRTSSQHGSVTVQGPVGVPSHVMSRLQAAAEEMVAARHRGDRRGKAGAAAGGDSSVAEHHSSSDEQDQDDGPEAELVFNSVSAARAATRALHKDWRVTAVHVQTSARLQSSHSGRPTPATDAPAGMSHLIADDGGDDGALNNSTVSVRVRRSAALKAAAEAKRAASSMDRGASRTALSRNSNRAASSAAHQRVLYMRSAYEDERAMAAKYKLLEPDELDPESVGLVLGGARITPQHDASTLMLASRSLATQGSAAGSVLGSAVQGRSAVQAQSHAPPKGPQLPAHTSSVPSLRGTPASRGVGRAVRTGTRPQQARSGYLVSSQRAPGQEPPVELRSDPSAADAALLAGLPDKPGVQAGSPAAQWRQIRGAHEANSDAPFVYSSMSDREPDLAVSASASLQAARDSAPGPAAGSGWQAASSLAPARSSAGAPALSGSQLTSRSTGAPASTRDASGHSRRLAELALSARGPDRMQRAGPGSQSQPLLYVTPSSSVRGLRRPGRTARPAASQASLAVAGPHAAPRPPTQPAPSAAGSRGSRAAAIILASSAASQAAGEHDDSDYSAGPPVAAGSLAGPGPGTLASAASLPWVDDATLSAISSAAQLPGGQLGTGPLVAAPGSASSLPASQYRLSHGVSAAVEQILAASAASMPAAGESGSDCDSAAQSRVHSMLRMNHSDDELDADIAALLGQHTRPRPGGGGGASRSGLRQPTARYSGVSDGAASSDMEMDFAALAMGARGRGEVSSSSGAARKANPWRAMPELLVQPSTADVDRCSAAPGTKPVQPSVGHASAARADATGVSRALAAHK